ncbi:Fur family transcriptional regulator [uncultured Senegalimassilia sp.]|uniref:Fur family transcriptional regulator n=1 Tax=uncultured Senegalimassilia sp. TaxID=1714350 RepID=UPI00258D5DF6|nr:transcriptional repressor [uncultured Senegalimassilia sp.]
MAQASAAACETVGTRNTKQRALVLDAVRSLHNHPTSAEIYEVVHQQNPNVSRATVYRNLGVLSDRGEVLRIPVPNAADRYDFRCDNHFHAKCERCGGVFDIETEGVDPFARITKDYGFQVTGFDLAFSGVCPQCANGEADC